MCQSAIVSGLWNCSLKWFAPELTVEEAGRRQRHRGLKSRLDPLVETIVVNRIRVELFEIAAQSRRYPSCED